MRYIFVLILAIVSANVLAKEYNVKSYGAIGDGVHIDTPAINAAIDAASKEEGGVVVIPAGTYLSYSIHLKSNVTIRMSEGAVIRAAMPDAQNGYDEAEPFEGKTYQDFGHSHWHNSLMWGEDLRNVTIEGRGLIDGTGVLSRGHRKDVPVANKAIAMKNCMNVTIKDITLLQCGHFALLLTGVDSLLIDGVVADTNRDGFDIDCCEHVVVRNCRVNTFADDAIVLKCSYALNWMKPTADVQIEDCEVSGYDIGTYNDGTKQKNNVLAPDRDGPTGRIKLGTESNSAFRDITIRNCRLTHCRGLAFETVDGAVIENVKVDGVVMEDICNSPIYITIGKRMRAPEGTPASTFRDIMLSNITAKDCDSRYAILINGQPGNPIESIKMENVSVEFRGGITLDDVKTQRGRNSFFEKHDPHYPEPSAHGIQPAWGVSAEHVRSLLMKNVSLKLTSEDEREKYHIVDVEDFREQ